MKGFTLAELLVGILFSTITASAIITGSIYVKKTLNNVRYKELAYEHLKGHTEFWKGRISSKDIPAALSDCEENLCLKENESEECIFYASELCYNLLSVNTGDSNARRWDITTTIKWENANQGERDLSFYVVQMEF
tara:strand:- start:593 stop:1000 length:408 start_codon:yes stop_codon:yes gene_type:complete